jgi:hypothetical protein
MQLNLSDSLTLQRIQRFNVVTLFNESQIEFYNALV